MLCNGTRLGAAVRGERTRPCAVCCGRVPSVGASVSVTCVCKQEKLTHADDPDAVDEQLELDFDSDGEDIRLQDSSLVTSVHGKCRAGRGFITNIPSDWSLREYLQILYHIPHFKVFLRGKMVCRCVLAAAGALQHGRGGTRVLQRG